MNWKHHASLTPSDMKYAVMAHQFLKWDKVWMDKEHLDLQNYASTLTIDYCLSSIFLLWKWSFLVYRNRSVIWSHEVLWYFARDYGKTWTSSLWYRGCMDFKYTTIFLTNRRCIVYCSLRQCLTLVYPWWGQKSEHFCLLVTTHRLRGGMVVGYRHSSQGPLKCTRVRDNRRYLVTVCLASKATEGYLQ